LPQGTFTVIMGFLGFFELGARAGQTDRQTGERARRVMLPVGTTA